jgi:hypothetical protein
VKNERVQMDDVSADTKSAVAKGAAVRDLRGACRGASTGGAAKVQQRCSSWVMRCHGGPSLRNNLHPMEGAGHGKQCADLTHLPWYGRSKICCAIFGIP